MIFTTNARTFGICFRAVLKSQGELLLELLVSSRWTLFRLEQAVRLRQDCCVKLAMKSLKDFSDQEKKREWGQSSQLQRKIYPVA